MRFVRLTALVWALVTAFAGSVPARADESLSIIAGAPPNVFDLLELVAEGAGFYKAEHLAITKNWTTNAPTAAQLVATGKADVASLSVEPLLQGYDKGLRMQLFLSRQPRYSYVLAVLDGSPIRTLADFKGKDLGENSVGSAAEPAAQSMLAGVGLKKTDYSFVTIGAGAQALEAFIDKRVDGVAFPFTALAQYEVAGHVKIRIFQHPILSDIGNVGYAALPATIQTQGRRVAALFARHRQGGLVHPRQSGCVGASLSPTAARRWKIYAATGLADMTRYITLIQDYLPAADPGNKRIGYLSPQGLEVYSKLLTDFGITSRVVPSSAIVTDQFIAFANDFDHQAVIALAKNMH